jgi:hypothetical protein
MTTQCVVTTTKGWWCWTQKHCPSLPPPLTHLYVCTYLSVHPPLLFTSPACRWLLQAWYQWW